MPSYVNEALAASTWATTGVIDHSLVLLDKALKFAASVPVKVAVAVYVSTSVPVLPLLDTDIWAVGTGLLEIDAPGYVISDPV